MYFYEAEIRAKDLEEEICRLQNNLERNEQLQASTSTAEKAPLVPDWADYSL
ncbi:hypothetical protein ACSBR2_018449 [Camellia fascicularis]